ncbi:MAG: M48 family metallopeptidase [Janthinobacterium lividum]
MIFRRWESTLARACLTLVLGLPLLALAERAVPPASASAAAASAAASAANPDASAAGAPVAQREDSVEKDSATAYAEALTAAAHDKRLEPAGQLQLRMLREIVQKLVPYSLKWNDRARNWHWEVNLVRSPQVSMVALPGGKILVYTGMLDKLGLKRDEIALLISHEIAHALREHARARAGENVALQQAGAKMSANTASGTANGVGNSAGSTTDNGGDGIIAAAAAANLPDSPALFDSHYDRDDETEADVIGADIASRAGFDPRAAVTLWRKLAAANQRHALTFVANHPVNPARIRDIEKRLPDMMPLYARAIHKSIETLKRYPGVRVPVRKDGESRRS